MTRPDHPRPGWFYLVARWTNVWAPLADPLPHWCGRLPIFVPPQSPRWREIGPPPPWRPWRTVDLNLLLGPECKLGPTCDRRCPLSDRIASIPLEAEKPYWAGVVWLPARKYRFPEDWAVEVMEEGTVRWPLRNLPKGGARPPKPKMPVLVGHVLGLPPRGMPNGRGMPALRYVFRIERIVYVLGTKEDWRRVSRAFQAGVEVEPVAAEDALVGGRTT